MLKFRQIPGAGRLIIVAVAVGVFAIALVACATSYNAIYRLVGQLGLYGQFTTQGFPLLLDAAFLVAESAAILGYIMRAVTHSDEVSYGWPVVTMLVCGACTVAFNVAHAYLIGGRHDPLTVWRCAVASLPPVLMILSFQVLIIIVKWTMLHLGRGTAAAVPGASLMTPGGTWGGYGAGTWPPEGAFGQNPSTIAQRASQTDQNGHDRGWKGEQTREYLATLDKHELAGMTRAQLTADMHTLGVPIDETYAGAILGKHRANGAAKGRRR
jgi:hypothetical protein